MTPLEISEYKRRWMMEGSHAVALHSDLRAEGVQWCKQWMNVIHWNMVLYTDVYQDTFHFKKIKHAKGFAKNFPEYAKIIED